MQNTQKNEILANRIKYWENECEQFKREYGKFSNMVERCSAMIGSLRILRDRLNFDNPTNIKELIEETIKCHEFILLPFYWDRCTEIRDLFK